MQATAGSITDAGSGYSVQAGTAWGSGTVDSFNALIANHLQTLGSGGGAVNDSVFTAHSGAHFSRTGVVPEPATWALVGLAIPVLIRRRHRFGAR